LRVTVKDRDESLVARAFSNAVTELALASYAGFFTLTPPGDASSFGFYWPALVDRGHVHHTVTRPDGTVTEIASPSGPPGPPIAPRRPPAPPTPGPVTPAPLGAVCGARSGDKGGNANIGVWTWDDDAYACLSPHLTLDRLPDLIPASAALHVRPVAPPDLPSPPFVILGILGEGVASSVRADPQAKGLGEYLRSRVTDIPVHVLERSRA
jgi:hypothetical protein